LPVVIVLAVHCCQAIIGTSAAKPSQAAVPTAALHTCMRMACAIHTLHDCMHRRRLVPGMHDSPRVVDCEHIHVFTHDMNQVAACKVTVCLCEQTAPADSKCCRPSEGRHSKPQGTKQHTPLLGVAHPSPAGQHMYRLMSAVRTPGQHVLRLGLVCLHARTSPTVLSQHVRTVNAAGHMLLVNQSNSPTSMMRNIPGGSLSYLKLPPTWRVECALVRSTTPWHALFRAHCMQGRTVHCAHTHHMHLPDLVHAQQTPRHQHVCKHRSRHRSQRPARTIQSISRTRTGGPCRIVTVTNPCDS
jgi:hypothetical protein